MNVTQHPVRFACHGNCLYGVASVPETARRRGVIVVVGGPQYRVGSHRQFAQLARQLASRGTPVLRFDYRGMGDSEGEIRSFDRIDDDLRAAVDHFTSAFGVDEVVLWGLCDGASAATFYAAHDARVAGVVLANPWARSRDGLAKATIKHYYRRRLVDPALWKKILTGRFAVRTAWRSLLQLLGDAARGPVPPEARETPLGCGDTPAPLQGEALRERMRAGLAAFNGRVLLISSGADLTAQEFLEMENNSNSWKALLARPQVSRCTLAEADHTFSRRTWRDRVAAHTAEWIESW